MKTLNSDAARLVGVHPGSANAIKAKQAEIADVWTNLKSQVGMITAELCTVSTFFASIKSVQKWCLYTEFTV